MSAARMTVWDWDLKTGTVVSSATTRDIFGVNELTGDLLLRMIHPEDRPRMRETIQRALAKERSYSLEFRVVRPDGTVRWVCSRGITEVDSTGRPRRMIGIASDITGQRRAAAQLRAEHAIAGSLATARTLQEAAPAIAGAIAESFDAAFGALWLVDPDGGRLRCGAVQSRGASGSGREFAGRRRDLCCARGEGLPGRVWATGEWAWTADLRADPEPAHVAPSAGPGLRSAAAFPIHADGHVAGVIEVFCDQSLEPDEAMLESMRAVASDIGRFVRRRRAEEEAARQRVGDALREAARRKDEFLAMLGHELRNPLAPIRNCLDILRLANTTPAQKETARLLMERQVVHLSRLVDDLLDVSRVSSAGERVDAASEGAGRAPVFTPPPPLERKCAPPAAAPVHTPRRVLIVEDDISSAASMSLLLELSGHTVAVAHDGPSGVETARQFRPEVVVCDIGLPGEMDGYAVAEAFRADPELRPAFLIALTGYGQHEDRRRAEEAGFDTHLTKPADPSVLKSLLSDAARGSSDT